MMAQAARGGAPTAAARSTLTWLAREARCRVGATSVAGLASHADSGLRGWPASAPRAAAAVRSLSRSAAAAGEAETSFEAGAVAAVSGRAAHVPAIAGRWCGPSAACGRATTRAALPGAPSSPAAWSASRSLSSSSAAASGAGGAGGSDGNGGDKPGETAEERLERLKENPFYSKYADKLSAVDPSELESTTADKSKLPPPPVDPAVAQLFQPKERKAATGRLAADKDPTMKSFSPLLSPPPSATANAATAQQPLDSIMRLDKLEDATGEEIGALWTAYHKEQNGVGAVIPSDVYETLRSRTAECPMFVMPLPRSEGIEFYLSQWRGHQAAFTSLLEYKTHMENARPYLLLNHYTELQKSKGVVLMAGDLDENVSLMDAQYLANQLQLYYLGDDEAFELVRKFNHSPDSFDYNEVLTRLDKMIQAEAESAAQKA